MKAYLLNLFPVVVFLLTEMQKWNTETKGISFGFGLMFKSKLFLYKFTRLFVKNSNKEPQKKPLVT